MTEDRGHKIDNRGQWAKDRKNSYKVDPANSDILFLTSVLCPLSSVI